MQSTAFQIALALGGKIETRFFATHGFGRGVDELDVTTLRQKHQAGFDDLDVGFYAACDFGGAAVFASRQIGKRTDRRPIERFPLLKVLRELIR